MRIFKQILSIFLCVCILSVSVGTFYFDSSHIEKVEAAEVVAGVGLTTTTIFQLCLFVGATVGTVYLVDKAVENRDEIAKAGKDFIDSITDIPDTWVFNFTDSLSGQEYVLGSEALQLVQDTPWEVIQGGKPSGDDDDNNKNGWKDKLLNLFSPANQMVGGFERVNKSL